MSNKPLVKYRKNQKTSNKHTKMCMTLDIFKYKWCAPKYRIISSYSRHST